MLFDSKWNLSNLIKYVELKEMIAVVEQIA